MSEVRARIARRIERTPGIHFNELVRELGVAAGQVQYHTRRLLERGEIEREQLYGKTHFYGAGFEPWERGLLALLRRETDRAIIGHLLERGESRPGAVAEELGVARSTLEWHLDRLIEQDVVEKRRVGGNRVSIAVADPDRTRKLLASVSPSLPDRFLDRFTRLVDSLFE